MRADGVAWALCNRAVTDLRQTPSSQAERVNQALLGDVMRILESSGDWAQIRLEHDGYPGWIHRAALHPCSFEEASSYSASGSMVVSAELLPARLDLRTSGWNEAGKLPFGLRLPLIKKRGKFSQLQLPDGRLWWVESSGLLSIELCPTPTTSGIAFALDLFKRFVGVPYLWGGRSPFGFDCSGFAATFWNFLGVNIPRDADQQFLAGVSFEGAPQPGDLLFFGSLPDETPDPRQADRFSAVSHVAISLGGDEILHANGTAWGVSYNSLDPDHSYYRDWLRTHFLGARRYA